MKYDLSMGSKSATYYFRQNKSTELDETVISLSLVQASQEHSSFSVVWIELQCFFEIDARFGFFVEGNQYLSN